MLILRSHRPPKHKARMQKWSWDYLRPMPSWLPIIRTAWGAGDAGSQVTLPQSPVETWAELGCLPQASPGLDGLQGGRTARSFPPEVPTWDWQHQPAPPTPVPGSPEGPLHCSPGEGRRRRRGGDLRQTYFQGFNPFCLKDFFSFFFFAWGRLGVIRGETQGADKLRRMGVARRKKYIFITLNY